MPAQPIWISNGIDVNPAWGKHIAVSFDNTTWTTINKGMLGVTPTVISKGDGGAPSSIMFNITLRQGEGTTSPFTLKFSLLDVQNHPTWTPNQAGMIIAVREITAWLSECCGFNEPDLATEATLNSVDLKLEAIKTAVELIDNAILGNEMQVDVISTSLPTGASTEAKQDSQITELTAIKTAVELLDNIVSGSEAQVDIVAALPSGENHIGAVGGNTSKVSFSITTSSTAYSVNDNIGGIVTLTDLVRISDGTAILNNISLWALGNATPNLLVDFWDASPTTGTYINDASQVIAGDESKWLGTVKIHTSDWNQTGVVSRCSVDIKHLGIKGNMSANIYMTIQDKTGVTFGSTAGLFGNIIALQD